MRRRYHSAPIPTIFSNQQNPKLLFGATSSGGNSHYFRLRYLIILPLIYLLAGLFINNLWRGVDANTYSVLLGFANLSEFQGEFFRQEVATSPAYYRILDLGVLVFGNWLDTAYSMRVTNALLITTGVIALYRTIRFVFTTEIATISALAGVTCLGGIELLHLATPGAGSFFAIAISIYGIALSMRRIYGGVVMGLGFVFSIMVGSGTIIPTLIPAIILLFLRREDKERAQIYRVAMLLAISMMGITFINFFVFTGRTAIEPNFWLPHNNIDSFDEWFNSAFRFLWFCMPLWPALIGFRNFARKQWTESSMQLLFIGAIGALCAFPLSLFSVNAPLMILPFLCILYAPAILLLNIQWQRASYWFYFLFFTIILTIVIVFRLVWSYFPDSSLMVTSVTQKHFPGFDFRLTFLQTFSTLCLFGFWFLWNLYLKNFFNWVLRPTISWILGAIILWITLVLIWLPAVNYSKSYFNIIADIHKITQNNCVDVRKTHFAFRVNWQYIIKPELPIDYKKCEYQLNDFGDVSRQSLLITDNENAKIEEKINNETANNEVAETDIKPLLVYKWVEIAKFNRPGETRETIVLLHKEKTYIKPNLKK